MSPNFEKALESFNSNFPESIDAALALDAIENIKLLMRLGEITEASFFLAKELILSKVECASDLIN